MSIEDTLADPVTIDAYVDFAADVLDRMDSFATLAGERNKRAFSIEEVPAENAAVKLAQADNFIFGACDEEYQPRSLLANQMVPLYHKIPMLDRLEISGRLVNKVSGGSILHLNLAEQVTDEAYLELVRMMVEDFKICHFSINVGTSSCKHGHTEKGIHKNCPTCGEEINSWAIRVVGFSTDTDTWSKERQEEFKQRQFYGAKDVGAINILPGRS